jgi:flagellar hook-associated protein 3 FlgL
MTTIGRITQRSIATHTLNGLQTSLSRLSDLQEKLSSGRQLNRPSDSPTGAANAMSLRSEIAANKQWTRNADDGLGWLGTIDQTLTTALDTLHRARDLTIAGLNSGAADANARAAMATEVDQIRDGLIATANTTYLNRPVFGGTTNGAAAYDSTGNYLGPAVSTPVQRVVGATTAVRVDVTGPEVFGAAGADLFTTLSAISTALRAGNTAGLQAGLGQLDAGTQQVTTQLTTVGAAYNRIQQMQQAANDRVTTLTSSLSDVENIDLPATVVELNLAQAANQAALTATQRVITPSLADFLR